MCFFFHCELKYFLKFQLFKFICISMNLIFIKLFYNINYKKTNLNNLQCLTLPQIDNNHFFHIKVLASLQRLIRITIWVQKGQQIRSQSLSTKFIYSFILNFAFMYKRRINWQLKSSDNNKRETIFFLS